MRHVIGKTSLILVAATWGVNFGCAADVTGFVGDWVGMKPKNGIAGATVSLKSEKGAAIKSPGTDAGGSYQFMSVPDGEYTVVVNAVGYHPQPHDSQSIKVMKDNVKAADILLWPQNAGKAYFTKVGTGYADRAKKGTAKDVYTSMWREAMDLDVPPSQKYWLVQGIVTSDESAATSFPRFGAYKNTDLEAIQKLEAGFRRGFGGDSLPSKGNVKEMKVPDEVVADIVLNQLLGGRHAPKKQEDFFKRFRIEWEGTPALDDIKVWGKEKRTKSFLP